jgi:hypothetical protein
MATSEGRDLTAAEANLISWLLRHGETGADRFLSDVCSLRVVGGCTCGCASIDFTTDNDGGMSIISDFGVTGPDGLPGGVFLFTQGDRLAGLEVYSPGAPIAQLPTPESLKPLPMQ